MPTKATARRPSRPTAAEPHAFQAARRASRPREQAARLAIGRPGRAPASQALERNGQARVPRDRRQGTRRPHLAGRCRERMVEAWACSRNVYGDPIKEPRMTVMSSLPNCFLRPSRLPLGLSGCSADSGH